MITLTVITLSGATVYKRGLAAPKLEFTPKMLQCNSCFVPDPRSTCRVQHVESSSVPKRVRMRPGTRSTRPCALKELKTIPSSRLMKFGKLVTILQNLQGIKRIIYWVSLQILTLALTSGAHSCIFSNKMGIWNPTIQNPETLQIQTFWRSDFKGSGFQRVGLQLHESYGSNHSQTEHFCLDF